MSVTTAAVITAVASAAAFYLAKLAACYNQACPAEANITSIMVAAAIVGLGWFYFFFTR